MEQEMKFTKESGKMINHMVMEHINILQVLCMQEIGKMENNMDKVNMNSPMAVFMQVAGSHKKCMDKEHLLIIMGKSGQEYTLTVSFNQKNKEN